MIRLLSVCALSLALLHGCARPQPMGEGLWRAVQHEDARR
jgi:hypothetical protein